MDDPLFPEGSPAAPTNGNPPSPVPEGEPGGPGGESLTKADMLSLIKEFVEPNTAQMDDITKSLGVLQENQQSLAGVLEKLGLRDDGTSSGSEEFDATEFLTNPGEAVKTITEELLSTKLTEVVGPLLSQLTENTFNAEILQQERAVDEKWGSGTWKEEFLPELQPIFDKTRKEAPSRLSDTGAIARSVDAIKGLKYDKLLERGLKHEQTRTQKSEEEQKNLAEIVRSNLSGGIARAPGGSTLDDEAKEFLGKVYNATGEKPDEQGFLRSLNTGSTLAEWEAAQPKAKSQ